MARVRRSPLAEEDFREIWRHIAQYNPVLPTNFSAGSMRSCSFTRTIHVWELRGKIGQRA
jgi:hypothetical protein